MKKLILATLLCLAWMGQAGTVVVGNGNTVMGGNNLVKGDNNFQNGDQTLIIGSDNFNQGSNRQILGDNQYFSSEHPEYQTYRNPNTDNGPDHPHHASFDLSGHTGQTIALNSPLTAQTLQISFDSGEAQDPNQVIGEAQVLDTPAPDFLQSKRLQIIHRLQNRLHNRIQLNSGPILP